MSLFDIAFILIVPFVFTFVIKGIWKQIKYIKRVNQNIKKLEAQKCKGPHSWLKMSIIGQEVHVCKDCCYSADIDGYVKREFVNAHIKEMEFMAALEEFTIKRKKEIAEKFNLKFSELEKISEEVVSIKKDFTIKWLEKSLKEMEEERSEKV
jgi:hypothetical protein